MKLLKVFLNPGHDRKYDSGACNKNGRREADMAYEVGVLVKRYLETAGCLVMLVQSDNLTWEERAGLPVVTTSANEWDADVAVSIHCNAFNSLARGTETLCYSANSNGGNLAKCIHKQMISSIPGLTDRGIKERKDLGFLKRTDMPAALVEMAFIDNDQDLVIMEKYKDEFARAIARGITDYFQNI